VIVALPRVWSICTATPIDIALQHLLFGVGRAVSELRQPYFNSLRGGWFFGDVPMTVPLAFSTLLGIMLGLRCKMPILFPAVIILLFAVGGSVLFRGGSRWTAVAAVAASELCLQCGYLLALWASHAVRIQTSPAPLQNHGKDLSVGTPAGVSPANPRQVVVVTFNRRISAGQPGLSV
jgi:hypothetical protein